jgi:hypothetical protein
MELRMPALLRKRLWILLVLLGMVLFIYPFKNGEVPEQHVLVVTEDWRPVEGALVRQSWKNYSLESEGHEEDFRTDNHGRVTLPKRTMRASILRRILHPIWNVLTQGVHSSFGIHTDVLELGEGTERRESPKTQPQSGEMIFRRRSDVQQ